MDVVIQTIKLQYSIPLPSFLLYFYYISFSLFLPHCYLISIYIQVGVAWKVWDAGIGFSRYTHVPSNIIFYCLVSLTFVFCHIFFMSICLHYTKI